MRKLWILCMIAAFGNATFAGEYEEGLEAAQRGDFAVALEKWMIAADQGDARAQYYIGYMYRRGDGVRKNDVEAAKWLLKAAVQGLAPAQDYIGWMYANGIGVQRN